MEEQDHLKVQEHRRARNRTLIRYLYALIAFLVVIYAVLSYFRIIPSSTLGSAFVVLIFGITICEILARIVYYYMINDIHKAEAATLSNIVRILGYALVLLLVLYIIFGYQDLGGLFVSAGFLGIILGLAAQATLSNFIAGIYLIASNTIEPDDNVVFNTWQYSMQPQSYPHDKFVPGISGTVEAIGVLYTKVINEDGIPVYIPNNIVAQALVINYHRAKEHMRKLQFDVDISIPFSRLKKIIEKTMKAHKVDAHQISVEYLHQSLYVVTVRLSTPERNLSKLKSEVFRALIDEINAAKAKK